MKRADPQARWEAVERWLAVAEDDRRVAVACMAMDPPSCASAAFHCQQAVEKLLKGFLVLAGKRSRKTHSLARLGAAAQGSFPDIAELMATAETWSDWLAAYRYPSEQGPEPAEPSEDELRRALATIETLAAQLRAAQPE